MTPSMGSALKDLKLHRLLVPARRRNSPRGRHHPGVVRPAAQPVEAGRQAHLSGPIAQALGANAPKLLAQAPSIERIDVLGAKLPG